MRFSFSALAFVLLFVALLTGRHLFLSAPLASAPMPDAPVTFQPPDVSVPFIPADPKSSPLEPGQCVMVDATNNVFIINPAGYREDVALTVDSQIGDYIRYISPGTRLTVVRDIPRHDGQIRDSRDVLVHVDDGPQSGFAGLADRADLRPLKGN